ncbi:MAG: hypothetical protein ACHQ06_07735 [Candidatus Dormibacteria bacterium]
MAFDQPSRPHCRVEALVEAVHPKRAQGRASRAFDAVHLNIAQAGIDQVLRQLVGKVEIRGRKADDVTAELPGRMQSMQKWLDRLGEASVLPMSMSVANRLIPAATSGAPGRATRRASRSA